MILRRKLSIVSILRNKTRARFVSFAMKRFLFVVSVALSTLSLAHEGHDHGSEQSSSSQKKAIEELTAEAQSFLSVLPADLQKKAMFDFQDPERENWKFTPQPRKGLPLEDLSAEQQKAAKKLLATILSQQGLLKVNTIQELEKLLGEMENDPVKRNHQAYFTSFFGQPESGKTWGYRYEGHHIAVNVTIIDGKSMIASPTFLGASPAQVREGRMQGTQALAKEENLARALAESLHQRGKAVVYSKESPAEILTAENRVAQQLEPVGVPMNEASAAEVKLLFQLIAEFAHRYRSEVADAQMHAMESLDLKEIRFAWAGSLEMGKAFYYRIQTPKVLIETANSQNNANHIHTVWRDHANDFGRDSLGEHYRNDAH